MLDVRFRPMTRDNRVAKDPNHKFKADPFNVFWPRQLDEMEAEIRAIDGRDLIIEACFTSDQIRNDGWPRGGASAWAPDVRLYVTADVGPLVFPCATYKTWQANLRAISLAMQGLRLMRERGIGMGTEQYRGYAALPASIAAAEWLSTLHAARFLWVTAGWPERDLERAKYERTISDMEVLRNVYRDAAKAAHPDKHGGSDDLMAKVNRAKAFIEGSA